jgi:hypothetical protein
MSLVIPSLTAREYASPQDHSWVRVDETVPWA